MKTILITFKYILRNPICTLKRNLTNEINIQKRNELFEKEKTRQKNIIKKIEKIEVEYIGVPKKYTLLMNKGFSTPYNCAMHMEELLMNRSILALVNNMPWDMHRPLTEDCTLDFLHFKDKDPSIVNDALWRSGSIILGYIMERAFRDKFYVELCTFPKPNIKSGSFIYDVDLKMKNWSPSKGELECLSRIGAKLIYENNIFERLDVNAELALEMFKNNRYKRNQIPDIASKSETGTTISIYRFRDHVDISKGPLIPNTNKIGRFTVTTIEPIDSLYRVQGILMPKQIPVHFWTYEFLCQRAKKFNDSSTQSPLPKIQDSKIITNN